MSPDGPDLLLATTQQGLARSTDGGRSFSTLISAPPLSLLGWADSGTLTGLDPAGVAYVSSDGGSSWEERGRVGGSPTALTVTDDAIYVALEDRVVISRDGGESFEAYSRAS